MYKKANHTIPKIFPALILTVYISAAVFSALACLWFMPTATMGAQHKMSTLTSCVTLHGAKMASCPLTEAVATRSSLVAATFSDNNIFSLLAIIATVAMLIFRSSVSSTDSNTINQWKQRLRWRLRLRLFQPLIPLFSRGIIQPKLYV